MDADRIRMFQLAKKGYYCSQILIIMGLEARGERNPDLARAVGGLARGCGEGSYTCGSLTGGCCLLSLFTGRGCDKEERHEKHQQMAGELVRWLWQKYRFKYGGIECMAIRDAEKDEPAYQRCWQVLEDVFFKVNDILNETGFILSYKGCYAS
jgi:hypothetical protein